MLVLLCLLALWLISTLFPFATLCSKWSRHRVSSWKCGQDCILFSLYCCNGCHYFLVVCINTHLFLLNYTSHRIWTWAGQVVIMYDFISRVYDTASSMFLGHFCLTAGAKSGLFNNVRICPKKAFPLLCPPDWGTLYQLIILSCHPTPPRPLHDYVSGSGFPLHKVPSD